MKDKKRFCVLLSAVDVLRLYRLVEDCRMKLYGDEDLDRLYRCLSKAYAAVLDDVPVTLLYPGAIDAILKDMGLDGVVSGDDIS